MRRYLPFFVLFILGSLDAPPAGALTEISTDVVASGGAVIRDSSHEISGTIGQAAIGTMTGTAHRHEIGFWWVKGQFVSDAPEAETSGPTEFLLGAPRPNPGGASVAIRLGVPVQSVVSVQLFDPSGRRVRTIVEERLDPGFHGIVLDGTSLPSGIYFCQMKARNFSQTRRLVLLR